MRKKVNFTSKEIYDEYHTRGGTLSKEEFVQVTAVYNREVMRHVIEHGRAFDCGHGLSTISITKHARNFSNPTVNWGASNVLRAEIVREGHVPKAPSNTGGEEWLVYFTDPWWFKFHWRKSRCKIPNRAAWKFVPSRGRLGTHVRLIKHLNDDHQAHTRFDNIKHL